VADLRALALELGDLGVDGEAVGLELLLEGRPALAADLGHRLLVDGLALVAASMSLRVTTSCLRVTLPVARSKRATAICATPWSIHCSCQRTSAVLPSLLKPTTVAVRVTSWAKADEAAAAATSAATAETQVRMGSLLR
jgi:hypothetical protein